MAIETKKWLKSVAVDYIQGQPLLLMYLLDDKEIEALANQVEQLVEYKIMEREEEQGEDDGTN
tara:strand:+ start:621 stop:809 length:189 start_codon:yes stop_codon:yes gene_type:complete